MSEPGFGQPSHPADNWPQGEYDQDQGYPYMDADASGIGASPYPDWQRIEPSHDDTDLWAYPQESPSPAVSPANAMYGPQPDAPGYYGAGHGRPYDYRHPRRFPWHVAHIIILLVLTVTAATLAVLPHIETSGQPSPAAQAPAITRAQAEHVVANFFKVDNHANEKLSSALLATIEGGTSYPMDAGLYQVEKATNSGSGSPPVGSTRTIYYIPRQPASAAYPHWFAVQVTVAPLASPQEPDGTGYMVFSQASPGAPWKDVAEPEIVTSGPAPQIATDAQGYATQVTSDEGLGVAPGAVSRLTATALDAVGAAALKVPGGLADQQDEASLRSQFPSDTTVTDTHQAAAGPVFALRTKDGGAIVFYSVTAQLTVVPPPGETLQLDVPGFYSPSQVLNSADLRYVEQFAAYVPPTGHSGWQVVAAVSNISSQG